jgi:hypothetical protein
VCVLCSSAIAFEQKRPEPWDGSSELECAIVKTTENYKKDEGDPIYKISLSLVDNPDINNGKMVLNVAHVAASGAVFDRDDQYKNTNLRHTPDRLEYTWTGTMIKNKNITMSGTVWRDTSGKWFYSETQYKNGKPSYQMLSRCHTLSSVE